MNPVGSAWRHSQSSLGQTLAANPRLRIMLVLMGLVIVAEMGMKWLDHTESQLNERAQLMAQIVQLKSQTRDPKKIESAFQYAQGAQKIAATRLLEARSEALAQAQLQDWMGELTQQANTQVLNLNIGNARPASAKAPVAAPAQPPQSGQTQSGNVIEVPVTLAIRFTPESLTAILNALEGAPALVRIESLSVRRPERRVDLGIVVPVRIKAME